MANPELCNLTAMPHHLDVAVISYKFSELRQQGDNDHIIELDPVDVSEYDFKRIFYYTHHNHNTFCVNKQYPCGKEKTYNELVSFACQSVDGILFSLSDEILDNIELDLGISRHMLSTCSLINLTKEINGIRTLRDLPTANVTCSLKWSDIVTTLRSRFRDGDDRDDVYGFDGDFNDNGYQDISGNVTYTYNGDVVTRVQIDCDATDDQGVYIGTYSYKKADGTILTPTQAANVVRTRTDYFMPEKVPVVLSISVIFITPNEGVAPTVVKFNYNTSVTITLPEKC